MQKKIMVLLSIGILLLAIVLSGCVSEKKTSLVHVNVLGLTIEDLPKGYVKLMENYSDNPPSTQYGIKPLEAYDVVFIYDDVEQLESALFKFGSVDDAKKYMDTVINDTVVNNISITYFYNAIPIDPIEEIGDESQGFLYVSKFPREDGKNVTYAFVFFRLNSYVFNLGINGFAEKDYMSFAVGLAKIVEGKIESSMIQKQE